MSKHKRNPYIIPAMSAEELRRVQERKRSGAAGTHGDRRTKRNRTRGARKATALKDW